MRVLIAPGKFKGSLSALETAQAFAAGWAVTWPKALGSLALDILSIAAGREDASQAIQDGLGGEWVPLTVADSLETSC